MKYFCTYNSVTVFVPVCVGGGGGHMQVRVGGRGGGVCTSS